MIELHRYLHDKKIMDEHMDKLLRVLPRDDPFYFVNYIYITIGEYNVVKVDIFKLSKEDRESQTSVKCKQAKEIVIKNISKRFKYFDYIKIGNKSDELNEKGRLVKDMGGHFKHREYLINKQLSDEDTIIKFLDKFWKVIPAEDIFDLGKYIMIVEFERELKIEILEHPMNSKNPEKPAITTTQHTIENKKIRKNLKDLIHSKYEQYNYAEIKYEGLSAILTKHGRKAKYMGSHDKYQDSIKAESPKPKKPFWENSLIRFILYFLLVIFTMIGVYYSACKPNQKLRNENNGLLLKLDSLEAEKELPKDKLDSLSVESAQKYDQNEKKRNIDKEIKEKITEFYIVSEVSDYQPVSYSKFDTLFHSKKKTRGTIIHTFKAKSNNGNLNTYTHTFDVSVFDDTVFAIPRDFQ